MRQSLNIEKMPAKKKFTVTVTLKKKPENPAFSLNLYAARPDKDLPYQRIFLANDLDFSIKGVVSVTVNGVEIPEEFYIGQTRDRFGNVMARCGFRIRDEVELQDFELVMQYGQV